MSGFLLDTDICVFRILGHHDLESKFNMFENECFLSEITVAELRFGAERGNRKEEQHHIVDVMCNQFKVLPITKTIRIYAAEKARLWERGTKIEDFDLLIGATALYYDLTLVTNNTRHFERMQSLRIENWIKKEKT